MSNLGSIWVECTVQIPGTDVVLPLLGIQPPEGQSLDDVDHRELDREAVEMGFGAYVRPTLKSDNGHNGFAHMVVVSIGNGRRELGGVPIVRQDAN